jgi:hypothetical protein
MIKAAVQHLDTLIAKSVVPADIDAYRGLSMSSEDFGALEVGAEIGNLGFTSVSTDKRVSEGFMASNAYGDKTPHKVLLHMTLAEGSKGYPIGWGEEEVVLPRGAQWKISKMEDTGGQRNVWVELVS